MASDNNSISRKTKLEDKDYKWGFTTDVETEVVPKGLNEEIVKIISIQISGFFLIFYRMMNLPSNLECFLIVFSFLRSNRVL